MPEATLKLPPRVPKSVIVRPANSGCLNADSEDGNTPTAPIPLAYAVPAGPNSFHAKTLPGVRVMLVSAARSAAWGQDESNATFPGTRLLIRDEVPIPIRDGDPRRRTRHGDRRRQRTDYDQS